MECPVCYETRHCKTLTCNHHICNSCFSKWCEKHHSCPMCRRTVITSSYPNSLIRELYFLTGGKLIV